MNLLKRILAAVRPFFTLRALYWTSGVLAGAALLIVAAVFVMDGSEGGLHERLERNRFRAYVDSSFNELDRERYAVRHRRDELALRRRLLEGRKAEMKKELTKLRELTAYFSEKEKE